MIDVEFLQQKWNTLIDPLEPIEDEAELRRTRFLAGLSLIVAFLVAILGLIILPLTLNPIEPYKTLVFWDAFFGVPLFFVGYYYARRSWITPSIVIMTLVSILGPGLAGFDNFLFAIFMNVGVVFAIAFTRGFYKYLALSLNIMILIGLGVVLPEASLSSVASLVGFAILLAALIMIFDAFRRQAEQTILQMNENLEGRIVARTEELQNANNEIKQFVYIVSHDLRSPLVNLKGFSSELRLSIKEVEEYFDSLPHSEDNLSYQQIKDIIQEDIPEALNFIETSTRRMDHFTSAMLQLSRLGRREVKFEQIDLDEILQNVLDSLSHSIINSEIEIQRSPLPIVIGDDVMLEQIFGNLITNAIKFLDPGRKGTIEILSTEDTNQYTIHIKDNGRGISLEDGDKVFAPFRRAGAQDTEGEGMGLAYVQALVRRQGGTIWYESGQGSGTTFSFTIPKRERPVQKTEGA